MTRWQAITIATADGNPLTRHLRQSHGGTTLYPMRVIALSTLKVFWTNTPAYQDAEEPTLAWYRQAVAADWSQPADIKAAFGTASILQDGRVVFNLAGIKYRLVVWINYDYRVVYVRFIGTHKQYDKIDVQNI